MAEQKVKYTSLVNRDGAIYNLDTEIGYPTQEALAKDLGVSVSNINWNAIDKPKVKYEDLEVRTQKRLFHEYTFIG